METTWYIQVEGKRAFMHFDDFEGVSIVFISYFEQKR